MIEAADIREWRTYRVADPDGHKIGPPRRSTIVFLLLVIAAIVLGIVVAVAKGLLSLLVIGAVLLAADLVCGGMR